MTEARPVLSPWSRCGLALCSSLHPGMVTKAVGKQLRFTGSLEEVEVASTLLICWDERLVWACRAPEANLRVREIHTGNASSEASGRLQVSVPANLLNLLISSRNCHNAPKVFTLLNSVSIQSTAKLYPSLVSGLTRNPKLPQSRAGRVNVLHWT